MIRGSADFLGINHYTSRFVRANDQPLGFVVSAFGRCGAGADLGVLGCPVCQKGWAAAITGQSSRILAGKSP